MIRIKKKLDLVSILSYAAIIVILIPITLILLYGFAVYRSQIGLSTVMLKSILLTIVTSGAAAIIIFLFFTPLAYELGTSDHRRMETISDIPASIPHPIVGIAFLLLGSPFTPTGRFLSSIGINFFYTIQGLIAALIFVSAPIYIRTMQSVFASRSRLQDIYARSIGASRAKTLYLSVLPLVKRETVYASLTSMSRAMSEFGSISILAYLVTQYPFTGTSNASVQIAQYYDSFGPGVAITASALMIVFSLAILIIARLILSRTTAGDRKI